MQKEKGSSRVCELARGKGFLTRLLRDVRGNTLAIVGAALVPLAAMIGSGVDMSRAYMAKTRLQSACDAAALAGRRVMSNDQLTAAVTNEAVRFFNFNFPQRMYQTDAFTPAVTRPSSGVVRVTASTRIPTSIMKMFGFTSLPLSVTCDASLNFVNTDVLLVLDVTGSMASELNGVDKIDALRDATMALYDELRPIQTQLESNGLRLRYGIVPYSSTVNVGDLIRDVDPDFLANSVEYRSRVANYNNLQVEYIATAEPPQAPVEQTYSSAISQSNCDKYGRNVSFSGFNPSATTGGGPAPAATWTRGFANNEESGVDWGWSGAPDTNGSSRSCRRRYVQTNTTYTAEYSYSSSGYTYQQQEPVDVSDFKLGGPISYATSNTGEVTESGSYDAFELAQLGGTGITTTSLTWNGCIEERVTVDDIDENSGYAIPNGAFDLDINLVPHDDDTRWRPMIPEIYWRRNSSGSYTNMAGAACPYEARRLQAWERGAMQSYVNALVPTGNTYHDIGMLWGARLISNGGVFGDSADTFNGMPVARHIIFMTDGQLEPNTTVYSAYGVETNDQRVTGSSTGSGQYDSHMQRFRMICNAVKGMNVSVWVIAFGTTLSADMAGCASNANQASTSGNRDQLIARFREIGNNIGALRLTQ